MLTDAQALFSDTQAVTAAAASTNYMDLGFSLPELGVGYPLYLWVQCDVAMTDGSSNSTLEVKLQTDDNTSFSSASDVFVLATFPAVSAIGARYHAPLPSKPTNAYERYIRLYYTPANGDLSTGSFTAGLSIGVPKWVAHADGFTIS
jgi:hypothetical protein